MIIKPDWDVYFITMAFVVSQRSFDPSTKCGCVIVSKDKRVLSTGYNGPIKGSIDEEIPLIRPQKYLHMLHGEENALLAYNGSYQDIQESTAYITTGKPCSKCMRMMIQKGIIRMVYSGCNAVMLDELEAEAKTLMLQHHPNVKIECVTSTPILAFLETTAKYVESKQA